MLYSLGKKPRQMINEFPKITKSIQKRLQLHHNLYSTIKVRDLLWEHALTSSISEVLPNLSPQWDVGSQKIGSDISLKNGIEISCKSGQIHKDNRIKISSSRLSRFSDEEKIKSYLKSYKNEDYIACLSSKKTDDIRCRKGDFDYIFSVFVPSVFDYDNMTWSSFGKNDDMRGVSAGGVTVQITKAMGWQLWYYLPLELAVYQEKITISV